MAIYTPPKNVKRHPYPEDESDCKALVGLVFVEQGWTRESRSIYITGAGEGFPESIHYCTRAQIFAVLDKMIKWRLVLIDERTLPADLNEKVYKAVQQTLFDL